ncbi:MAG TPA: tyrosine-type recombinase/integrase, partial [Methylomirabilota bacterium]
WPATLEHRAYGVRQGAAARRHRQGATTQATRVSFHTLRHTAASWLTTRGACPRSVQEILDHASTAQTARYAHPGTAHVRADLERLRGLAGAQDRNGGTTAHGVAQLAVIHP